MTYARQSCGDTGEGSCRGERRHLSTPAFRHVLAIGRDPDNLAHLWARFETLGFRVVVATTLSGALAAWRARQFELIAIGSSIPRSTARALLQQAGEIGRAERIRLDDAGQHDDGNHSCLIFTLRHTLAP